MDELETVRWSYGSKSNLQTSKYHLRAPGERLTLCGMMPPAGAHTFPVFGKTPAACGTCRLLRESHKSAQQVML